MPRFPAPYFKKSHAAWYVQLDGRQLRLGPDRDQAFETYHGMMAARKKAERFAAPSDPDAYPLGRLFSEFLAQGFKDQAPVTRGWYEEKLKFFVEHLGGDFPVAELKPRHVEQWVASHPDWKKGTARTVWQAVQRLLRWGEKSGRSPHSSVCDYGKPGASRRTLIVSPEDYQLVRENIRSARFADLVAVAWETGARPQELLRAEVRHFEPDAKRIVFPPEEAKGGDWPRVVYLTDASLEIVTRLVGGRKSGFVFRNERDRPWTTDAVNCAWILVRDRIAFARMKAGKVGPTENEVKAKIATLATTKTEKGRIRPKTGAELREEARIKLRKKIAQRYAPKFCLYHFRHSWLDRMLKAGVDALTCAILLGHRDPSMVAKTYQHLSQSPDYLRAALKKAAG